MLTIRRYESIAKLPSGCEAMFHAGELDSFDLSADWFRLLEARVFSEDRTRIYVMQRDGEVRGVLPLLYQQTGIGLRQMNSLTNFYSSYYRPLLASMVTADELAEYLRLVLKDACIDVLRFDAMDPEHLTFKLLESAARLAGLKAFRFYCFGNWYFSVQGRSYLEYFQGLSSQVRNTVLRREKKFLSAERGRVEIVTGQIGLEDAIAAWSKIYNSSWKRVEPFPEFVPDLIRMCAMRGWLRLGIAHYDGKPVASQLWIVSHGRAVIYKLAYDKKFASLSAGTILTAHLMRHVLDTDRVKEVDYLVGDDDYKKDWMSHRRERWGIVAYNPNTLRGLVGSVSQIIGEARRALLLSPRGQVPAVNPDLVQDYPCAGESKVAQSMPVLRWLRQLGSERTESLHSSAGPTSIIHNRAADQSSVKSTQTTANWNPAMQHGDAEEKAVWTTFILEKSLGDIKMIWDGLNAELCTSNPYFDSKFIEPLLSHFGVGQERICIHRRGSDIDGLVIVAPSRLGKWSIFKPDQAQVTPILVRQPEDLHNLIHTLPGLSLGLDIPCQDPLYSPSFNTIQSVLWGPVSHAHTMGVRLEGEFRNYWDTRSANLRKSIGRRQRKVQDAGLKIHLKRLTESSDMQSAIARFGEMESAGWKGRNGTAVHADNVQGRFYVDVLRRFAEHERAAVYELYFNDALVAMQLCISSPDMLVLLKTTYDEQQASLSPGRLLLYALLENEFAEKRVREIEFYTNADSEQLAWATHDRWVSHYMLFRNRFSRMAYHRLRSLRN